ncbi:MAG: DUF4330 family protein [Clostridia bacterium]|nr:DUF4330 family protein [Clostridia bacterium]
MNRKKKRGPNIIDVIILLALILGIAGAVVRFYTTREEEPTDTVTLSIEATGVDASLLHALEKGGDLYLEDGVYLGRLASDSVSASPSMLYGTDERGHLFASPSTLLYDVRAKVDCDGRFTEGGFSLPRGRHLAAGQTLDVSTRYLKTEILLLGIEKN